MHVTVKSLLEDLLASATGRSPANLKFHRVPGGSINETWQVKAATGHSFFCKIHEGRDRPDLFDLERKGLQRLAAAGQFLVPGVIGLECRENFQILVMEWIEAGKRTDLFWDVFGERLALLHQVGSACFGLEEDNYMGIFRQSNRPGALWADFLVEQRLEPQVRIALKSGLLDARHARLFEKMYRNLGSIYPAEAPSLLHGDLWSGNFICNKAGQPVLIDPAVYFGHRSMDLGMTTLFGGFSTRFYESYEYHFPVPGNFGEQTEVSRLYPLLIHLNLFGTGYLPDIIRTIQRF